MAASENGLELESPKFVDDTALSGSLDEAELNLFGKKQQFKRKFRLLSMFSLTCTLMITWEAVLASFENGLKNGGPSGLVYGFLFAWIGTILQALVQGELGSMIPVAGGYYNWVAVLAPPSCNKFLSYLTGWITVIGYQANVGSVTYAASLQTQGLIKLHHPEYEIERWHGTLIFYAFLLICLFINTYLARLLPHIEVFVLTVHVIGFFCVLIPLVHLGPHGTASSVFGTFANEGGWSSTGLAFFVGLSTTMYPFVGSDAATHMAEEIEGASLVIPQSMVMSVTLNGILGFGILVSTLFCLGNLQDVLESATGFPYIDLFVNSTGSVIATTAMSSIVIVAFVSAAFGYLATTSRMTWAFAREKGLPGSGYLSRVETRTLLPLYSICLSFVINVLLALINIASSTAFKAMISLVISAYYAAFSISAGVLLHKRLTTPESDMYYGPFNLGRAGNIIIVISIVYSAVGIFSSFFPEDAVVNLETMNWSIVVSGGMFIFSIVFWFTHGKKVYTGPINELGE